MHKKSSHRGGGLEIVMRQACLLFSNNKRVYRGVEARSAIKHRRKDVYVRWESRM